MQIFSADPSICSYSDMAARWVLLLFWFFKKNTFSEALSVHINWFERPAIFSKYAVEQLQKNKWAKTIMGTAVKHLILQTGPLTFIQ